MQGVGRHRWCPGWDSNPHTPEGIGGFKPPASTDSATRARRNDSSGNKVLTGQKTIELCLTSESPGMAGPECGGLPAN